MSILVFHKSLGQFFFGLNLSSCLFWGSSPFWACLGFLTHFGSFPHLELCLSLGSFSLHFTAVSLPKRSFLGCQEDHLVRWTYLSHTSPHSRKLLKAVHILCFKGSERPWVWSGVCSEFPKNKKNPTTHGRSFCKKIGTQKFRFHEILIFSFVLMCQLFLGVPFKPSQHLSFLTIMILYHRLSQCWSLTETFLSLSFKRQKEFWEKT